MKQVVLYSIDNTSQPWDESNHVSNVFEVIKVFQRCLYVNVFVKKVIYFCGCTCFFICLPQIPQDHDKYTAVRVMSIG